MNEFTNKSYKVCVLKLIRAGRKIIKEVIDQTKIYIPSREASCLHNPPKEHKNSSEEVCRQDNSLKEYLLGNNI
jgi:hypothetical protein